MRILLVLLMVLFNTVTARALTLDPRIAQPNLQYYSQGSTLVMLDHHGGNLYR